MMLDVLLTCANEGVAQICLRCSQSRVLILCRRGSPWQHRGCLVTASATSGALQRRAQFLSPKQSQTRLSSSFLHPVRFYTKEWDELENLPPHPDVQRYLGQIRSSFIVKLKGCASPSEVVDLTRGSSLTPGQVSRCLTHMWTTTKKLSKRMTMLELQLLHEHPGLEELLENAQRSVGHMQLNDLSHTILNLMNLGIPQESPVVQALLHVCQDRIHDFNMWYLSVVASGLLQMDNSPNVVTLKDRIRLIVETHLHKIENVLHLQIFMRLLGEDAEMDLKLKLQMKALSMTDQFSLPNAIFMINIMAAMGNNNTLLVDKCSKIIKENLHVIPMKWLLQLLLSYKELQYGDHRMLAAISDNIASTIDVWSNNELLRVLDAFHKLVFCPDALMEAYAEKVIADPNALKLSDLLVVLKVYSSSHYDLQQRRPEFLDSLTLVLSSYLPNMPALALLRSVYYLCKLGHFPPALLEQLLQSSTLEELQEAKFFGGVEKMFQTVDLCLRLDRPAFAQHLSVPSAFLGLAEFSQSENRDLELTLQKVLKEQADTEVQRMVVVEKLYFIDAVITNKGESSQRLAVIFASPFCFSCGTSRPRGFFAVKLRHLKILGYEPVPVCVHQLMSMSEELRTDFLRNLIFPQHKVQSRSTKLNEPCLPLVL